MTISIGSKRKGKAMKNDSMKNWWLLPLSLLAGTFVLIISSFFSTTPDVAAQSAAVPTAVAKTVTLSSGTTCQTTASNYDSYLNACVLRSFAFTSVPKHLDCVEEWAPASEGNDVAMTCIDDGLTYSVPDHQAGVFGVLWENGVVKLLQAVNGSTDTAVKITYSASTRA
jgi:hypothetical protein